MAVTGLCNNSSKISPTLVTYFLGFFFPILLPGSLFSQDTSIAPLFTSQHILDFTISGPLKSLFKDRTGKATYYPLTLTYSNVDSTTTSIQLKAKTRGKFRRIAANCNIPPLLLNFGSESTPINSIFTRQNKLKLVTPCRDEKYVVKEYLVYKLYEIISKYHFKSRLVRVIYHDLEKEKISDPLYGILIEDEDAMADRYSMKIDKTDLISPKQVEVETFMQMAVFQFMIGNTDWSIQYRQNIKLMTSDTLPRPITVPYDFDHAGIVDATYAKPAPELQMSSVRERRYRGYCMHKIQAFDSVFDYYEQLKEEIYSIYDASPYLDERYKKMTLKYFDKFYLTLKNPKASSKAFLYPCDPYGTGNIVIKGL